MATPHATVTTPTAGRTIRQTVTPTSGIVMGAVRTTRTCLGAVAAVLALGCETTTELPATPPPALQILLTPGTLTLTVGAQGHLTAIVSGGDAGTLRTVAFRSANESIARVDSSGLVTAVGPGTATVTATALADPAVSASAVITAVAPAALLPGILIKAITGSATGRPVQTDNVSGSIDVTVSLDIPPGISVSRVELLVDSVVVSTQTLGGGARGQVLDGSGELIFRVNTAAYDGATGNPAFHDGPHSLRARAVVGGGNTATAESSAALVFDNVNFLTAARTVVGPCLFHRVTGLQWCSGSVSIVVRPVIFGPAAEDLARVTVGIVQWSDGTPLATTSDSVPGDGLIAVFGKTTLAVEDSLRVTVASVTRGGQEGPACINPDPTWNPPASCGVSGGTSDPDLAFFRDPLRIDNVAPRITRFDMTPAALGCPDEPCYVNGHFSFSLRPSLLQAQDDGVSGITASFRAGRVGALVPVTSSAQLEESIFPDYILEGTVSDTFGNQRTAYAGPVADQPLATPEGAERFGVDRTAPVVLIDGIGDGSINPTADTWLVSYVDTAAAPAAPSGFRPDPLYVNLARITAAGTNCYDTSQQPAVLTTSCGNTRGSKVVLPVGLTGYWRLTARVTDRAGNTSTTVTRVTLRDQTDPAVDQVLAPNVLRGTESATFAFSVSDDVELGDVQAFIAYPGAAFSLDVPGTILGAFGPTPLTSSTYGGLIVDRLVRSIETTTTAGAPTGTVVPATTFGLVVRDMAGRSLDLTCPETDGVEDHCGQGMTDISAAVLLGAGGTLAPRTDLRDLYSADPTHGSFRMGDPSTGVLCVAPAGCPSDPAAPAAATLRARITGPTGTFTDPFASVQFYFRHPATHRWVLIGSGTPAATATAGARVWDYTIDWQPGALYPGGLIAGTGYDIVALGLDVDGGALLAAHSVTIGVIDH